MQDIVDSYPVPHRRVTIWGRDLGIRNAREEKRGCKRSKDRHLRKQEDGGATEEVGTSASAIRRVLLLL